MILLADAPELAAEQLRAILNYLTALAWADGEYHEHERAFVNARITRLVTHHVHYRARTGATAAAKQRMIDEQTAHFRALAAEIDREVQGMFDEAVMRKEGHDAHVLDKLELRCYEVLRSFDEESRGILLQTCDELILADGVEHPAEKKLRRELQRLLATQPEDTQAAEALAPLNLRVGTAVVQKPRVGNHDFFFVLERPYPTDAGPLKKEAELDRKLVKRALAVMARQRKAGAGKLDGKITVDELATGSDFLDGFTYVSPLPADREVDLTVLGDLHGCYSCLKAAVLQSDFLGKLDTWRAAPARHPEPKLVFLGDYVDRGMYSFEGVMRAALSLYVHAPEQVYLLRGNHEHYRMVRGKVAGVVAPAEAIDVGGKLLPQAMLLAYKELFDQLPSVLLWGRTVLLHAGIPRDAAIEEKWQDLSSLNDPGLRFEMAWSDPSTADHVPGLLQGRTSRFAFGRRQFHRFMARIGANVLVRGHEVVENGFRTIYDDGRALLLNVFSSGGAHNDDLPPHAPYRRVSPAALTMRAHAGKITATPWKIDYEPYVVPGGNNFYAPLPYPDA